MAPWLALYEFTIRLPLPGTPVCFGFENRLPILPWTTVLYESIYLAVILAPWCARTRRDLRKLMVSGWVAAAVVFPFYWFVPTGAPCPPLLGHGPSTACWASSAPWTLRWRRCPASTCSGRCLWPPLSAAVVGRVLLGHHCRDVRDHPHALHSGCHRGAGHRTGAGAAARVEMLRRAAEWFANSWQEWRMGPVRVINHGFYAGAAAAVQMAIVAAAMGHGQGWKALVTGLAGLVGAGAWAQWVEGSSRLRRPFGFYGGLIGVVLACLCFRERWVLLAAHALERRGCRPSGACAAW